MENYAGATGINKNYSKKMRMFGHSPFDNFEIYVCKLNQEIL